MDLQLTDKRVLVAGSSAGIGKAVATTLAAEGAAVVITGRDGRPRSFPQIHRVAGGPEDVFANAYIIEGESGLAVIDAQARLATANRIYPGHGQPGGIDLFRAQPQYLETFRAEVRELSGGRPSLSATEGRALEMRMVRFRGHDRMARWIQEGANPVAQEITGSASAVR
jgi:hypothetical protein